jgi:hypothetical protein
MLNENILYITIYFSFTNRKIQKTKLKKTERIKLVPEPDKYLKEEYENQERFCPNCVFSNPDTSVIGIKLEMQKVLKILGQKKTKGGFNSRFLLK